MSYSKCTFLLACAVSASTVSVAWAQSSTVTPPIVPDFTAVDLNKDSGVDRDEFGRIIIDRFESKDLNRDGALSLDEFGKPLENTFNEADLNRDGKLSQEELLELRLREFDRVDRNRNNILGPIEYRQWGLDD